jgi:hypothetical protein
MQFFLFYIKFDKITAFIKKCRNFVKKLSPHDSPQRASPASCGRIFGGIFPLFPLQTRTYVLFLPWQSAPFTLPASHLNLGGHPWHLTPTPTHPCPPPARTIPRPMNPTKHPERKPESRKISRPARRRHHPPLPREL